MIKELGRALITPQISNLNKKPIGRYQELINGKYQNRIADIVSTFDPKNEHLFHWGQVSLVGGRSEITELELIPANKIRKTNITSIRRQSLYCQFLTMPNIIICINADGVVIGKGSRVIVLNGEYTYSPIEMITQQPLKKLPELKVDIKDHIQFMSLRGYDVIHQQFGWIVSKAGQIFDMETDPYPSWLKTPKKITV